METAMDDALPETVYQAFRRTAARFPDRPFLAVLPETAGIYGIEAGEITYAEAAARVEALRQGFAEAGYGLGHRAGLLLQNRPDFLFHFLALNALGVSVVPINPDYRAAELEYLIGHAELALAVATEDRVADLTAAAAAIGHRLPVLRPGDAPAPAAAPASRFGRLDHDTEAAVLYTSGTTGRPKGCLLPNEYFLAAGAWYCRIGGLCRLEEGRERMLTPLPYHHMNAMAYSVMAMVMSGGCLIVLDRFHPRTWWDSVRSSRATIVHYLGVMPAMLMKAPEDPADRAHQVRFGFGAGVDRQLHAPFEARFGFPLIEAWAMTETGAGAVVAATQEPRHVGTNCFGRPEPEVEVRIVRDDGREAGADEPGELLVRHAGPDPRYGFFRAYLKDPEATAEAWQGGYFHTGDIVKRDAAGYLYFVDRKKNVIHRSGENISAVEVEGVLKQHPRVVNVAVAAAPDPVRGDEVFACIQTPRPLDGEEAQALAQDIMAWCLSRLAYYKAPGYIAFVDQLPLTTTQKIQRGELKALVARLLAQGDCIDLRERKRRAA